MKDSGRGYSPVCPEGSTICCALVAVTQAGEGSSVLNLLCAKDQANENCEHRPGIQQIFWQVIKAIPQHIFPTAFSSHPSAPLSIYATTFIIFPFLKVVLETVYLKIGTQTHVAGTLCYTQSLSCIQLGLDPGQKPWCLVLGPNEAQALDVSLQKIQ